MVPFNIPGAAGKELLYLKEAIQSGHISGNGPFSKKCCEFAKRNFGYGEVFLTPSCTSALELAALLCDFHEGDEVILPSFTHAGTANAFIRAGARLVFADSKPEHPNIDADSLETLLGPKTRAVVVIHYAGMACEMERLQRIARSRGLILIEDAAHALGACYMDRSLGSWGDFAAISFHETKNISCGLGGMLILNRPDLVDKARCIWNQGTNRADFERGDVSFYTWVRPGGSFQLSDLNAAYLYPQLLDFQNITARRMRLWQMYYDRLLPLEAKGHLRLPVVPEYARHNAHIFYLLLASNASRNHLIQHLKDRGYQAVIHYIPLHMSPFVRNNGGEQHLPNCERIADTIIRLPLYGSLSAQTVGEIARAIEDWRDSPALSAS
jgi:dTDP-4-amino-4,6-dideoxygalactose transaminase